MNRDNPCQPQNRFVRIPFVESLVFALGKSWMIIFAIFSPSLSLSLFLSTRIFHRSNDRIPWTRRLGPRVLVDPWNVDPKFRRSVGRVGLRGKEPLRGVRLVVGGQYHRRGFRLARNFPQASIYDYTPAPKQCQRGRDSRRKGRESRSPRETFVRKLVRLACRKKRRREERGEARREAKQAFERERWRRMKREKRTQPLGCVRID